MSEKIVYLVGKTHLFKISNLVYDGREMSKTREGVHTGTTMKQRYVNGSQLSYSIQNYDFWTY